MEHIITRHRHELKHRSLTVRDKSYLTPHMIRIVLEGEDLADFSSLGADDHVKLFLPSAGGEPERRDYTPRRFDTADRSLTLDFAVHEAGPATAWAIAAEVGDSLTIGGPRGSMEVSPTFDWWLLIGDETALPAIGRRIEELPPGTQVISLCAVPGAADEQAFDTGVALTTHWVHRPADRGDDPEPLLAALGQIALPEGEGYVWIGAEATVARALRDEILEVRKHPRSWFKAAGYWKKGEADVSDKLME